MVAAAPERELLEKRKEGNARTKSIGSVSISSEAFVAAWFAGKGRLNFWIARKRRMKMAKTKYNGTRVALSSEEVMQIRRRLLSTSLGRRDFGAEEPLSSGGFESAVQRQNTGFGNDYKYCRPHEIAASLFYGIAMNHSFENGNKRTALVAALVALKFNGVVLSETTQDDLYVMATKVVSHEFPLLGNVGRNSDTEVASLASWFRKRTVSSEPFSDRSMQFPEFRQLLLGAGCEIDDPSGNFICIRYGKQKTKIGYPREKHDVDVRIVKKVRHDLGLDSLNTTEFYNLDVSVDNFVNEYSEVLERLADA